MSKRNIIFSKMSSERRKEFAIRTDILKNGTNEYYVEKYPIYPEGISHIKSIYDKYVKLKNLYASTTFNVNYCEMVNHGIRLQYLQAPTMDEILYSYMEEDKKDQFCGLLDLYKSNLYSTCKGSLFEETEKFVEIFGKGNCFKNKPIAPLTNIDAIFANIFVDNTWTMIDYEWTFEFPIPMEYAMFRAIFYFANTEKKAQKIAEWNIYQYCGIDDATREKYVLMELNFQEYVQKDVPTLGIIYGVLSQETIDIRTRLKQASEMEQDIAQKSQYIDQLHKHIEGMNLQKDHMEKVIDGLKVHIKNLEAIIHEMRNTKVWKLYMKYRKMVERNK